MRQTLAVLILATSIMSFAAGPRSVLASENQVITLPVRDADFAAVQSCALDENPACRQCANHGSSNISLMNYSILHHALQKGGVTMPLRPVPSPNSERSRVMVADGSADIKSDWAFNIENNDAVLKTAPIILAGELEKGLYGHRGINDVRAGIAIEDAKDLRGVSIRNWRLDWQVMEDLTPKSLISAPTVKQMFALIDLRRADFTLLEFSSEPDMGREIDGIRLVPFAGVKVSLPESQHFMVSRKLPHADEIVDAVNRGIKILREEGFIRRCLVNSGMINQRVEGWRTLNQTMPPFDKASLTVPSN
tara:strand:- start:479 stop:1396 length:918 start_codon:yes stop_codon:yes gene_type:complete